MPREADFLGVEFRKLRKERRRQLLCDVAVHFVSLAPWFLGRVDVEACAGAKVP
jgi:hypothetical protein